MKYCVCCAACAVGTWPAEAKGLRSTPGRCAVGELTAGTLLARTRGAEADLEERLELKRPALALESRLLPLGERSLPAAAPGPWLSMALEHGGSATTLVSEAPLRNLRASGPFTQHTAQSGHAPQFSHSAVLQQSESRALGLEPNSTQLPQLVSTNSELGLQLSKHKNWLLMPLRHPAVALVKASWLETLHKHSKRPQSSH